MAEIKAVKTNFPRAIEAARRDLLDLGLRNPLLNYKPLRSRGLDIIDQNPPDVFRILVKEEKRMTFLSGDQHGLKENGDVVQLAQPDELAASSRHTDLRLQTQNTSEQLQSRLLATYHAARTSMEEQGVNTLYLALGMISWREDDTSEKFYRAPLVLIPVELERSDTRDRFHLKYTGEDLGENVSLAEKLKQEFGFKEFPGLPDTDDVDVRTYFQAVAKAIRGRVGWKVETEAVALGFFSFAKFLMYRDLDSTSWPNAKGLLENKIVQSLLGDSGFQSSVSNYPTDGLLDDQLRDRSVIQVVDADSSQTIALLDAMDGHNMVIQGPPGTGKSQTIVNLISAAVGEGKRVLFVSEKMAALDVVRRRLEKVRLGGLCLELHSNRTNKKTIIEELKRTIHGERLAAPAFETELALLTASRDRLNDYCKAVNGPIASSGETPCSAYGKLLNAESGLREIETPPLRIDAANWSAVDTARRGLLVNQLQDRLAHSGAPHEHPFWGSRLTMLLPTDREEMRSLALRASAAAASLEDSARTLAESCFLPAPSTPEEAVFLCESARCVSSAPDLTGIDAESPEWLSCETRIRQALELGKRYRDLRNQYSRMLRPDAWTRDVADLRRTVAEWGGRWWRLISGRWRHAKREVGSLCSGIAPSDQAFQLSLLEAIAESAEAAVTIAAAQKPMTALFSSGWAGVNSDWDLLPRQAHWVISAQRSIQHGLLRPWCLDRSHISLDRVKLGLQVQQFDAAQRVFLEALQAWIQKLQIDESRQADRPLAAQRFCALISRWAAQSSHVDDLHGLISLNQIAAECEKEDLQAVVAIAFDWGPAGTYLVPLYERARLRALLDRAFLERPSWATFDGSNHGQTVEQFRHLDLFQLEHHRASLSARHAQSLPAGGGAGEIAVLWREFEKRTRFLPIRSLMLKAGHAIQSIKPVFMMSPLSIANYLPPGTLNFDLIVFDEASQVKPIDALGAIARGKQIVVVGDSKQLPPTSFFDSLVSSDDTPGDEEDVATSDIESILGLFCARGAHQRMLRWHYRSCHESLITVSNHLFYDDQLVVFPSPTRERKTLGLVYRRLENAWYERSRTRTNPTEAKAVATAVMAHARSQLNLPKEQWETLGVAAFSAAQMDAVLNQVELLRREDAAVRAPDSGELFCAFGELAALGFGLRLRRV